MGLRIWNALMCIIILVVATASAGYGVTETWQSVQLLNDASQTSCKSARVSGSQYGGFHACYKAGDDLIYKRYQSGSLGASVWVYGWHYNPRMAEALNGDIHIVWEDWQNSGVPIGYAVSTNGGSSFATGSIANYNTKFPFIAPYGTGSSASMVVTAGRINYPNVGNNNLYWSYYNGSSWSTIAYLDNIPSEYYCDGIARSPVDGSVWKIVDDGTNLCVRRYNGAGWESPITLHVDSTFRHTHTMAIDKSGRIMVGWTGDSVFYTKLYTPGEGVSDLMTFEDPSDRGRLCAMPNRHEFYVVYISGQSILGKRFYSGVWGDPVIVSSGMGMTVDPSIAVDGNGVLYATLEAWPSGNPQQYYSSSNTFAVSDTTAPGAPPAVYDDGVSTDSTTDLHFSWLAASDPESGVERYEYSIGTSPGATDVRDWILAGTGTDYTAHNLSLNVGTTYYINVRAVNWAGLEGPLASSDGILCGPSVNNIYFGPPQTVSSSTNPCEQPMLASGSGLNMHLVYREGASSSYRIGHNEWNATGWQSADYISSVASNWSYPDVCEDEGGNVHAIFEASSGRESNDIYENVNSGGSWATQSQITYGSTMCWYPKIAKGNGAELAHYVVNGDGTSFHVKHAVKTAGGWSTPVNISSVYHSQRYGIPDLAVDSVGDVHVVWTDGSRRVLYAKRTSGVWSSEQVVYQFGSGFICHPRIAIGTNDLPHIVCADHDVSSDPVMYYFKQNAGGSWSSSILLSNGYYPAIAVDEDDNVHVVYGKTTGANQDIYHKYHNGGSWSQEQNLSNNSGSSDHPTIRVDSDNLIHVAWQDNTTGTYKIVARRSDTLPTCASIKQMVDGSNVELRGVAVTAIFTDENAVYVEEETRASGVRLDNAGSGLAIGDRVNVTGVMATTKPDGSTPSERYVDNATVTVVYSGAPLEPLAMTCKNVGGASMGLVPGVTDANGNDGVGLNNIGLLVTAFGKVTRVMGDYLYIDDGSEIAEEFGETGILVTCAVTPSVSEGDYISVTGVVCGNIPYGWSANRRYIRLRSASDLVVQMTNSVPSIDSCAMSHTALVANDSSEYTVTLVASDTGGVGDIVDMRVLFDIDTVTYDPASGRGYMAWGATQADITAYGGSWNTYPCSGGGYWGYMTDSWGYQYITPVSAVTLTNGNARTVEWTFKVKPQWVIDGPQTGNYVGMWSADRGGSSGWLQSDNLFGLTFTVQP